MPCTYHFTISRKYCVSDNTYIHSNLQRDLIAGFFIHKRRPRYMLYLK